MNLQRLVFFKAYAELRSEASRYYLSIVWWVLEPILSMGVYYLVFGVLISRGTDDYVPFLLIGLAVWNWFENTLNHGMSSIYHGGAIMNLVKIPKVFFPAVKVVVDTVKFLFVLILLVIFLWSYGYEISATYYALPVVMLIQLFLIVACTYFLASIMPMVPDLTYAVSTFIRLTFFCSGIFFSVDIVPEKYHSLFYINPMAVLINSYRDIFMYESYPDWTALMFVVLFSLGLYVMAKIIIAKMEHVYPRILSQ